MICFYFRHSKTISNSYNFPIKINFTRLCRYQSFLKFLLYKILAFFVNMRLYFNLVKEIYKSCLLNRFSNFFCCFTEPVPITTQNRPGKHRILNICNLTFDDIIGDILIVFLL